jgi:hypothetical protein
MKESEMDFEKRIGTDFDNVSQRLVYNYIATQPDFRPVPSDVASETAQRQFYDFIAGSTPRCTTTRPSSG